MLNWFSELFNKFGNWLVSVLPQSPFRPYIEQFQKLPYLGYLNWFIPVGVIVKVFFAYLGAISLFYVYSIIARWVKLLGE